MKESIYDRMTNAEIEVASVLKEMRIKWRYEHPIFVWDDSKRPRVWTPDFYLTHFGIYVEVCGSKKFDYEFRKKIYKANDYDVIFLHLYKKPSKWRYHLFKFLQLYTNYRNRELSKIKRNLNCYSTNE